jgi:hypothetical protein
MSNNDTANFQHNVWKAREGREERQHKAAYADVKEFKFTPDRVYWHDKNQTRSAGIRFPASLLRDNRP